MLVGTCALMLSKTSVVCAYWSMCTNSKEYGHLRKKGYLRFCFDFFFVGGGVAASMLL